MLKVYEPLALKEYVLYTQINVDNYEQSLNSFIPCLFHFVGGWGSLTGIRSGMVDFHIFTLSVIWMLGLFIQGL